MINKIHPCLWFNGTAQAAAEFYCSIFKNSRITVNTPMVVTFEVAGQKFMGLNGGNRYSPNPSVSFFVLCETKEEIEQVWENLVQAGKVLMPLEQYDWSARYGWVQDKFGISWQLALGKIEEVGQKISPALLFTNQAAGKAEEAVAFYTAVFHDSAVTGILKYGANENEEEGTVKHAQFRLGKQVFMAMDSSGPHAFSFSPGISLVVECRTQAEIDYYWDKLTAGGQEDKCGWLVDKFGVSWQIVPIILGQLMSDPEKAPRVTQAFLQMKKFDIDTLINA